MITIRPEKIESDIYRLFEKEFSTWVKREGYIEQLLDQDKSYSEIEEALYEELLYEEWDYVYRECIFEVAKKYAGNLIDVNTWHKYSVLDANDLSKYLEKMSVKYEWFEDAVDDVIRSVLRN